LARIRAMTFSVVTRSPARATHRKSLEKHCVNEGRLVIGGTDVAGRVATLISRRKASSYE